MPHWARETYKALQCKGDLLGLSFGLFFFPAISGCFKDVQVQLGPVMKRAGGKDPPTAFLESLTHLLWLSCVQGDLDVFKPVARLPTCSIHAGTDAVDEPAAVSCFLMWLRPSSLQRRLIGPVTLWMTEVGANLSKRGFIFKLTCPFSLLSFGGFYF